MAYTMKEFAELDLQKIVIEIGVKCASCQQLIQEEFPAGTYTLKRKPVHRDCYFDDLGEETEKHPIGLPHVHRAAFRP